MAVDLAFSQTDEGYRRFIAHIHSALALKPGAIVADIGTGESPEQALHMSKAVGEAGKVIRIDIDETALEKLRTRINENGLKSVETRLGKVDDPSHSVDAVLTAFAYRTSLKASAMLMHILGALHAEGRLVVIEAISKDH
jgi:ubiquinone/menaquinone biosynthesis C-methylase UbiE